MNNNVIRLFIKDYTFFLNICLNQAMSGTGTVPEIRLIEWYNQILILLF